MNSRRPALWTAASLLALLVQARPARAQDAFEIQVYDAETAPPGDVGVEVHANVFAVGSTTAEAPELSTNHVTHLTLEPHFGIASWCEAGAYIQTAIRGDGNFDFAGLKLRFKARIPRRLGGVVALALNVELSSIPVEYEAARFGSEVRPIIDINWRRLYVGINPIIAFDIGGPLAGHPQLEPAAKIAVTVAEPLALGVEYYAALGPVDQIAPPSQQAQRLFGVLDAGWSSGRTRYSFNVGAGYDFTGPDKVIVKTIFSFDYDRQAP